MTETGPIFIGGTGRCGTTVLVRSLDQHPRIFAARWESQFLVAPRGLINLANEGFPERRLGAFLEHLRGAWFRRILNAGKANEYEAGLSADVTEAELEEAISRVIPAFAESSRNHRPRVTEKEIAELANSLFEPAMRRAGATRWCEKTPRNILFVDQLYRIFPNMRFVHIVRDGRDVVASMLSRGFWPIASGHEHPALAPFRGDVTLELAARYWSQVLDLTRQLASDVPAANYREVRFEQLVLEPSRFFEELSRFLGEEFSNRLLALDRTKHHMGRWRTALSAKQIEDVQRIIGDSLEREGYV